MTQNEFAEEEFQFIEALKNSSLYQEMKSLSNKIDDDPELVSLSQKRDSYLQEADKEKDPEKKKALLIEFNKTDEELRSKPLMKEYLERYQQIRHLLNHLSDELTKEIKEL